MNKGIILRQIISSKMATIIGAIALVLFVLSIVILTFAFPDQDRISVLKLYLQRISFYISVTSLFLLISSILIYIIVVIRLIFNKWKKF